MAVSYKDVWESKAYRWNLIASMIGRLGDSIDMIGFSWMMYGLTRSAFYTAFVFGINMLPTILLQPLAGALIERLSKKKIIVLSDLARSALTTLVLFLYVLNRLDPIFLLAVTFLNNLFEAFRMPAATCFLADTLTKDKYERGVSLYQSLNRTCELIGTGIAGVIISSYGIKGTLLCDLLAFLLCAIMISRIHLVETNVHSNASFKDHLNNTWIQLKEGMHYLISKKAIFMISIVAALINAGLVPFNSFESAYIRDSLHGSAILLSQVSFCISFGSIIGAFVYPFCRKFFSNKSLLLSCGLIIGAYNILLASLPMKALLVCGSLVIGVAAGCGSVLIASRLMAHVEKSYLARISALFNALSCSLVPLLSLFVAFISKKVDILPIFFVFGMVFISLFIFMYTFNKLEEI